MTRIDEGARRSMVPRWRVLRDAVQSSELYPLHVSAPINPEDSTENRDITEERVTSWRRCQTLSFAGDLLGSAFALPAVPEVCEAAKYVVQHQQAPAPLRRLATHVLGYDEVILPNIADGMRSRPLSNEENRSRREIQRLRHSLRITPRDAIGWMHIAREYAITGQEHRALRAIATAVALGKQNRFVLRSAVRGYVHFQDPDTAWAILRHSPLTKTDPWLMAAEIATAMMTDRDPRSVKEGRNVVKSGRFLPSQTTELSSALASLELNAGSAKQAKKLFRLAMIDANDNTIAQAEWATRVGKLTIVDTETLPTEQSYEAQTWQQYVRGEWAETLRDAQRWLEEEPFSSRPVQIGSFVASVLLEDYSTAEILGQRGLAANPSDQTLLNNLAFALASADKVSAAVHVYQRMRPALMDREVAVSWLATGGLIQFRLGLPEAGQAFYRFAMDIADRIGAQGQRALACCYLAREEIRAGLPSSHDTLREAYALAEHTRWSIAKTVADRLQAQRDGGAASQPRDISNSGLSLVGNKVLQPHNIRFL